MSDIQQCVSQQGVGWVSWGVGLMAKPVSWALKNYLTSSPGVDEKYVVLATVKVNLLSLYRTVVKCS